MMYMFIWCTAFLHDMSTVSVTCRAIADTPFPFPWAQMVLIMLIMYAISVPLVVVAFVDSTWLGIVVNFFCVQSYWCLNEVARDLEDPFIYDPNDLPLARYQVTVKHPVLCGDVMCRVSGTLHIEVLYICKSMAALTCATCTGVYIDTQLAAVILEASVAMELPMLAVHCWPIFWSIIVSMLDQTVQSWG